MGTGAPRPANEASRLEELRSYAILDTAPQDDFDGITRLASRLFGTPMALISLVDDQRQWFKSHFGLEASETPRDLAFCAYAILSDQVMTVPDAALDPRFADNALVTGEPHIRFYAGAPLRGLDGTNLGTLCILDTEPRAPLSPEDEQILRYLADLAMMQMEFRRICDMPEGEIQKDADRVRLESAVRLAADERAVFLSIMGRDP